MMAYRSTSTKHSDSSSADDTGSDDEREMHWKRVRKNTNLPDLAPVSSRDDKTSACNTLPEGCMNKQRKVNTIWADVHSEQELSQTLSSGGVSVSFNRKQTTVQRGPESYDRSVVANRNFDAKSEILRKLDEDLDSLPSQQDDDLFDNVYLEAPEPLVPKSKIDKKGFRSNFRKRRYEDDRKKTKRSNDLIDVQTQPMKFNEKFDKNDSVEILGAQMASALNETKVDLIVRCLKVLGSDKCISLYEATETLEKTGGMRTLDRRRRRTPGGVFLQLLREDPDVTDDIKGQLFKFERENQRKIEHAKRKIQRHKDFEDLLQETKEKIVDNKEFRDKKEVFVMEALDVNPEIGEDGEILSNDDAKME